MIRIEGLSLERFLNMAARADIKAFDARRVSYTVMQATLKSADYRRLCEIGLERYHITVVKRGGAASGLTFLRRRKALLIGLLLLIVALSAASLFVWDVRIDGLEDEREAAAVLRELEDYGIAVGMYKGGFDPDDIKTRMLIDHDEIAWMDISCRGVVLTVEVVPAIPIPDVVDEDTPCSIVAGKDAYIESIIPLAGRAAVQPGDTVRRGDVLISGLVWDDGFPRMMFAARGEVVGSVWYTASVDAPIFIETRQQTGRTQTERVISIGRDSATVDGGCTFEEYDTQVVDTYDIGRILPVRITVLEHSEVRITKTPEDLALLKVQTEETAYRDAQAKMPEGAVIVGHRVFFDIGDDVLSARVYLQTHEDIGKIVYLEE